MDQNEMSNLYRGPSIDASYQVSYHLAMRFQRKSCLRNKNCLWRPCLLTDQNGMSNSHRGPSIDASYQVSVYLVKLCQRRRFLEIDQSEKKNCLWWPCLLTDWDKMSNLYKRTFHRCREVRHFQFYLHNGKFCNSVLHLKTAAVTMH
jgi:hypothetical protein